MFNKVLERAVARLRFPEQLAAIELASLRRLFQGDANLDDTPALEAMTAFAAMAVPATGLDRDARQLLDDLAHALCDAHDLVSRPMPTKRQLAERAAMFFNMGGHSAKASTIANAYAGNRGTVPIVGSEKSTNEPIVCIELATTAMWILNSSHVKSFASLAVESERQIGQSVFGEEGRFALFLSLALSGLADYLTSEEPATSSNQIEARIELLVASASKIADPRLVALTQSIAAAVYILLEHATNAILRSYVPGLSPLMRGALVGSAAESPIYQLWPTQWTAIQNGALSMQAHVISVPTSGGKTLIAELKMAKYLDRNAKGLAVYVAPYNALAAQVGRSLSNRFRAANIAPAQVWTGAYSIDPQHMYASNLLVTTPEKLDAIMRNSSSDELCQDVAERVGLFVFDECHLVGANSRGITYELLITRLRERYPNANFLAMSAVASNAATLATWIANNSSASTVDEWTPTRRRLLVFRPTGALLDEKGVEVHRLKRWATAKKGAVDLALRLDEGRASPVLIMCTQRGYAIDIAAALVEQLEPASNVSSELEIARIELTDVLGPSSNLPLAVTRGVAFHHAGLAPAARDIVERLASKGKLRFVASTTTLAEGVHLPFRSLIIPYLAFPGGEYMDRAMFQNIVGRAGRAFSNVRATVIVFEPQAEKAKTNFKREIFGKYDAPVKVASRLQRSRTNRRTFDDISDDLRIESQLLGFVQDQTMLDDQVTRLVDKTLATALGHSRAALSRKVQGFFDQLERADPPAFTRSSPYALTPYGLAASKSGVADRSARVLRRELELLYKSGSDWFNLSHWLEPRLPVDLVEDAALLTVSPLEFFGSSAQMHDDFRSLAQLMEEWSRSADGAWRTKSAVDRFLLAAWLQGDSFQSVIKRAADVGFSTFPFDPRKSTDDRELDVVEYFDHGRDIFVWMLSAAIHMSEQLCTERSLPTLPFRKMLRLFECGVPANTALRLVNVGLPRVFATDISPLLYDSMGLDDYWFRQIARTHVEANIVSAIDSEKSQVERALKTSLA